MEKKTAIITIEVDLDQVPGWGHQKEDFSAHILRLMNDTIPHYNPKIVNVVDGFRYTK